MDPIKVDFANKKGGANKKEIVIPPENAVLKIILSVLGTIIFAAVAYFIMIPAVNLKDYSFYLYLGMVAASYVVFNGILSNVMGKPEYIPYIKKRAIIPGIIIALLVVTVGVGYLVSSEFFRADSYGVIIEDVECEGDELANYIEQDSLNNLPKLDNSSATELATKALGDLADKNLVSQFVASTESTQINLDGTPTRVVPLEYANIIKWLTNTKNGLPGFVKVDMAKEEAIFIEAEIKYSTKEYLFEKLERHLRFNYPTYMFGEANFEVQEIVGEDGTTVYKPYWIVPVLDKTIGLFGGTDVKGAIKVDAKTGEHIYYTIEEFVNKEELKWVDRVYDSDLLVEQYNFHSKYGEGLGFWNSLLSQKGVKTTTSGYSFIAKDDDVWMYTGVTSVTSDSSITGFVLINQRTKETKYFNVTGGTEAAAQGVAEGRVQELGYTATFPIIVDIGGEPTYFMSLMDKYNVRQQFALIHVENFNKIGATGKTLTECFANYEKSLADNEIVIDTDIPVVDETQENVQNGAETNVASVSGAIADIRNAVINGNTVYFIKLEGNENYFEISASKDKTVVILNKGDNVTITYSGEGEFTSADSIKVN